MYYYNYHPYDEAEIPFKRQRYPSNLGFSYDNEFKNIRIDKINGHLLDNIVEYNKNLTPDEINGTNVNNIVKYNNLMNLSQFDKMLIAQEYRRLYGKSRDANIQREEEYQNGLFMNLSLSEIVNKFTETMMQLVHEIPRAYETDTLNLEMFTRDDRLIYIGILLMLVAFFIYFISSSK